MIYKYFDRDGTVIRVEPRIGANDEAYIDMRHGTSSYNNIASIPRDDAPALALAILEASGIGQGDCEMADLADAVQRLRRHTVADAEAKARADNEAKLDAEALTFCNALRVAEGLEPYDRLAQHFTPSRWRAVALKARELHAKP
uniref:hypothetical protein n=1 Tax=Arthrobacter silvisoli TaxID=2291022 RepID=UPI003F4947CA